jgi:hypothetical protein
MLRVLAVVQATRQPPFLFISPPFHITLFLYEFNYLNIGALDYRGWLFYRTSKEFWHG